MTPNIHVSRSIHKLGDIKSARYADDWLISPLGFALSPDLPRASEKAAKRYCAAVIKGYIFSRVRRFSEPLPFTVAPCWNRISKIGSSAS